MVTISVMRLDQLANSAHVLGASAMVMRKPSNGSPPLYRWTYCRVAITDLEKLERFTSSTCGSHLGCPVLILRIFGQTS